MSSAVGSCKLIEEQSLKFSIALKELVESFKELTKKIKTFSLKEALFMNRKRDHQLEIDNTVLK